MTQLSQEFSDSSPVETMLSGLPVEALALIAEERFKQLKKKKAEKTWTPKTFPDGCVVGEDGSALPFNIVQQAAMESTSRVTLIASGPQVGKSVLGPPWMLKQIRQHGRGDYLAVSNDFDMFHLKLLPAYLALFGEQLDIARFWSVDRMLEIRNPVTGKFMATKSADPMWARIILRSADDKGGLESATAKAIHMDEAGLENFDSQVWYAIRHRRSAIRESPILVTTTLYDTLGGWLKREIMDKALDGGVQVVTTTERGEMIVTTSQKNDVTLIQADSTLNPAFSLKSFTEAQNAMPDDVFQSMYRGRITQSRFAIYDVFDTGRHTCPRFEIPVKWKRQVGVDFGGAHTAAVFFAQNPDNKVWYGYREYHAGGKTAQEHVRAITYGEPSRLWAVGGSPGETAQRLEWSKAGLHVREPRISDVWMGINLVYSMLKQDQVCFFDDLRGTLEMFPKYRRKHGRDGHPTDDIESKGEFHFLDCTRYHATIAGGTGIFLA